MRLETENQITKAKLQSLPADQLLPSHLHHILHENKDCSLLENYPTQSCDYLQILARATNDAVRDWNVASGVLTWPQGLPSLLGYDPATTDADISFWRKNIHPEDTSRISASIQEALTATTDHWSGEYRFRRSDGTYLYLLERAAIVRDTNSATVRFIGSMMDITARKQLQDQLCRSQ